MTEDEMLEAAKYIAKRDNEVLALQQQLIAANRKFAGRQQALINLLVAALQGIVEHGTDSPEHRRAEQAIAIALGIREA